MWIYLGRVLFWQAKLLEHEGKKMFINEQSKRRKGNVKIRPKTDVDDQKWKDRCRISNFLTEKIFVIFH